ncbi:MAG: response regulator transcription factor [Rudaea sp.]|uniref:response regulator transcription factor n=1 Tax=unclassified Rudaea TaxID=2627037 RepID=UPI0010F86B4E|nr:MULTISPECIES: response regulator transcription factor [unclassified Rudaea]MBN8888034.1 response regulator transcription factor [Rudaea sp.]
MTATTTTVQGRILVIEDDDSTANEIVAELAAHAFEVDRADNGSEGLELALRGDYDVITLDRMLPDIDGLNVVGALRAQRIHTPVLMISALSDVDERVRGLRAGGDDYLTKPFASDEMAARVEVLLRRQTQSVESTQLRVQGVTLDRVAHNAFYGDLDLGLKPTEYQLLEFLMRNSGQTLTRTMIFEAVWGYHFDPGTNLIEVHIAGLRKKLEQAGCPALIHTVRGSGYQFGDAR